MENTKERLRAELLDGVVKEATRAMMEAGHGPKWFAASMAKRPDHKTLLEKTSPTGGKNLQTVELLEIWLLGDPAPGLSALCRAFGHLAIPIGHAAPAADTPERALLVAAVELGEVSQKFLRYTDPRSAGGAKLTPDEWADLEGEMLEAVSAFYAVRERLRVEVESE